MNAAAQARHGKPDISDGHGARACDPARRCIVTGAVRPRDELIRFVVGPDRKIYPDLEETLPGRGLWVTADAPTLATAIRKNHFSKAARAAVTCPPDLPATVAMLLRTRLLQLLGLAQRSGICVTGFTQVEPAVKAGEIALLLAATDAGDDGIGKLQGRLGNEKIRQILSSQELGHALGRAQLVYAGLKPQPLTEKIALACRRLAALQNHEKIAPGAGLAQIDPKKD